MSFVRDVRLRLVEGAQALDVKPPSPAPSVVRTLDDLGLDGAIIDNLLSADECARLVRACDDAGFAYWDPAGANDDNRRVRDAQTVEFCDRVLCAAIWERLRPFLPALSCVEREQPREALALVRRHDHRRAQRALASARGRATRPPASSR